MNLTIYCNVLAGTTTPKTLKIEGYVKKIKEIIMIDSGSTHNFIHCKIAQELNFFLYPAPKCQVMVVNAGLRERNQQRGLMLGITQRDFKEDGFSGKRHSLKAPKQPSPQLACQEFHRGANRMYDCRNTRGQYKLTYTKFFLCSSSIGA